MASALLLARSDLTDRFGLHTGLRPFHRALHPFIDKSCSISSIIEYVVNLVRRRRSSSFVSVVPPKPIEQKLKAIPSAPITPVVPDCPIVPIATKTYHRVARLLREATCRDLVVRPCMDLSPPIRCTKTMDTEVHLSFGTHWCSHDNIEEPIFAGGSSCAWEKLAKMIISNVRVPIDIEMEEEEDFTLRRQIVPLSEAKGWKCRVPLGALRLLKALEEVMTRSQLRSEVCLERVRRIEKKASIAALSLASKSSMSSFEVSCGSESSEAGIEEISESLEHLHMNPSRPESPLPLLSDPPQPQQKLFDPITIHPGSCLGKRKSYDDLFVNERLTQRRRRTIDSGVSLLPSVVISKDIDNSIEKEDLVSSSSSAELQCTPLKTTDSEEASHLATPPAPTAPTPDTVLAAVPHRTSLASIGEKSSTDESVSSEKKQELGLRPKHSFSSTSTTASSFISSKKSVQDHEDSHSHLEDERSGPRRKRSVSSITSIKGLRRMSSLLRGGTSEERIPSVSEKPTDKKEAGDGKKEHRGLRRPGTSRSSKDKSTDETEAHGKRSFSERVRGVEKGVGKILGIGKRSSRKEGEKEKNQDHDHKRSLRKRWSSGQV